VNIESVVLVCVYITERGISGGNESVWNIANAQAVLPSAFLGTELWVFGVHLIVH
jgi:hypothetical protein